MHALMVSVELWLELVKSNNNPTTIASLFLKAIEEWKIVPKRLRTDCGTENCEMAAIQCFLRRNHNDDYSGQKAHIYGSSHLNQRIEAWWSLFRKSKGGYIIDIWLMMGLTTPTMIFKKRVLGFAFL